MGLPRVRGVLLIGCLFAALGAGPSAAEQGYPSRLVRVIVPFPPGSTLDALARIVTDQLAHKWAQPVIIENISGGGGNIAGSFRALAARRLYLDVQSTRAAYHQSVHLRRCRL